MSRESWDQYFLRLAVVVASRSRDNSVQVGAILVDPYDRSIISTGYNDFPRGVDDHRALRRERPQKYDWTEHAERNAIYSAAARGASTRHSHLYLNVGGLPCCNCSRAIIQAGIVRVIMPDVVWSGSEKYVNEMNIASVMLEEAGVEVVRV